MEKITMKVEAVEGKKSIMVYTKPEWFCGHWTFVRVDDGEHYNCNEWKPSPSETAYEKARRLRRDMEASAGYYLYRQEKEMADAYEQDHAENVEKIAELQAKIDKMHMEESRTYLEGLALDLEKANAEIDRLNRGSWTDEDMHAAYNNGYCHASYDDNPVGEEPIYYRDWLADRRAAKGKE